MRNPIWGVPPRIIFNNPAEELTGLVAGKAASDLEERTARSLDKLDGWRYSFRIRINPITHKLSERFTNLEGELEIDFLVQRGSKVIPILVDGEIGHFYSQWQKDVDAEKVANIDKNMKQYGAQPAIRVPYYELVNQEMSDRFYRELLQ